MSSDYNENQIQILEGLEAVRVRPGMYIGSTSSKGLHHLVYEIVDNSIDEALAGFCSEIEVMIHEDNTVSVKDNGRGIPIGIHPQRGIPAVEVVFTILHAGGKFGGGGYKVSGGLHGVGASVVNALSEWLTVRIYSEGKIYEQHYSRGEVLDKLTAVGDCDKEISGTFIHFKPDDEIFDETVFDYDILYQHLQETAFLTKGVKIILSDLRNKDENGSSVFHYEGGIKEFVRHINKNKVPIYDDIFYCDSVRENISVEIAFQHNDGFAECIYSYANNINTTDGGSHLAGFKSGLTKTINDYGKRFGLLKESDKNLSGEDIREGLTCVLSVKIENPQFEGQTNTKLGNSEAKSAVESVLTENLTYFLEENPAVSKLIFEKALVASRARDAAKKARELVENRL